MVSQKSYLVRLNNYYLLPVGHTTLTDDDPVSLTRDRNKAWIVEEPTAQLWAEELAGVVECL